MVSLVLTFFTAALQLISRPGFDDIQLMTKTLQSPRLTSLVAEVTSEGFRYLGDTNSTSRACTDPVKKRIYIGKDKSTDEATLSLAYEVINAKNAKNFTAVHDHYLKDANPTVHRAEEYANKILEIESNAVLNRSLVAIELNIESQVKNPKYINMVKSAKTNNTADADVLREIHSEMLRNGTVHNGKKSAVEHYKEQYFAYNQTLNR